MFKKPKRNFRTRRKDSEPELTPGGEDEEKEIDANNGTSAGCNNNVAQNNSIPPLEKMKEKKKEKSSKLPKVPSVTSMLSFEQDDGDGEMFQIKKPKHSRHIAKQLKKASQREKEEVTEQHPGSDSGPVVAMQLGSDAEAEKSDESDQEQDEVTPSLRHILEGGQIPDAAMIHLIRKKRQQMAREMTEEFIPVDDKVKDTSTSRLIREEDHDRSDEDEDGERLNFAVNSRETELRHIQDTILAAEEGSHSEGSDQESEWEKQQILKGVKVGVGLVPPPQPATQTGGDYYGSYPGYVYGAAEPGMFGVQPHVPISYTTKPSTDSIDVKKPLTSAGSDVTVDQIKKALKERLDDMTSVHRAHIHERDDLASRFEASEASIIELDDAKAGLEERYRFFQEMKGYVRDLVECFNDKVPAIERIEKGLFTLLKQCSEKLVKRRQEDIKDQSQDYMSNKAALAPNLAAMNISGEDQAKQRRAAEREARRARRRRSRQDQDPRLAKEHNDGTSTDDEVNHSEMAKYKVERERLMQEAVLLFDNVVDDFHEARLIMSKFERWKHEQSDSYEEAYIGLCLPKLFTPLVRLKLVDWNPLENAFADVEAMSWYSALVMYGCHDTGGALLVEDSDIKLIPSIIEKVLLPKLTDFAEGVWDPLSSQQTKNLAMIVRRLISDYPTVSADSKNTQALMKAIVLRMRKTLDDDVFMPLYPKQVLENRMSGPAVFFHRQFSSSVKLLGNMLQWTGVVSSRTQQELALDGLLNRYLILALHNSHVNAESNAKCEAIVATFPKEWFTDLKSESTISKLEMLCRYLVHAASELYKSSTSGRDTERRELRESLKRITRMLVNIHAIDHATSLGSQYSLKISLH